MAVCSTVVNGQPQNLKFDRLSIDDGLSNSYVTCILQDNKGFMWFGTQDGLNKYDGYNFTVDKHDPTNNNSLSDNYIRSICETKDGILWIGTESGGLNKFDPATETFTHYQHEPQKPNSLSHNSVRVIYEDPDTSGGILWIGTSGGGLDQFNPATDTFIHYEHDPNNSNSLSNNHVHSIHKDKTGNLWIGTENGLNRLVLAVPTSSGSEAEGSDQENGTWTRYYHEIDNPNSLTHSNILSIYEDREGTLWIGTYTGLNKMEVGTSIGFKEIIQGYDFRTLCEDQFGILWIGSYLGVGRFDPDASGKESFIRYKHDSGDPKSLSGTPVTSIYEDRSRVLWFGTGGSGISKLNPPTKNFVHYRHIPGNPNSLSNPSVRGIYEDENGILWVGGYGGLNRIDRETGQYSHYRPDTTDDLRLGTNFVYAIIGDTDNEDILWIGFEGGGLYKFNKDMGMVKRYAQYSDVPDPYADYTLSHNLVFDLYFDQEGILWIATDKGVNKLNTTTDEMIHYYHNPNDPNSLSGNDIRVIYEDHNGFLWIGTDGNGLNLFNPETKQFKRFLHNYDNPNSLSNDRIKSIYESRHGREGTLWIGPNGAGKTTTIKMIVGLMTTDSGSILINGTDVAQDPRAAKKIIGYVPDAPFLYDKLTGEEFLNVIGNLYEMTLKEISSRVKSYNEQLDMDGWISDRIEEYSQGMKQRLAFAAAFLHEPKVIILDEPMVGLDPKTARKIKDMLREKSQAGVTVFLSTHNLNVAEELSDRIAIIHRGKILGIGSVHSFKDPTRKSGSLEDLFLEIVEREETNSAGNKSNAQN